MSTRFLRSDRTVRPHLGYHPGEGITELGVNSWRQLSDWDPTNALRASAANAKDASDSRTELTSRCVSSTARSPVRRRGTERHCQMTRRESLIPTSSHRRRYGATRARELQAASPAPYATEGVAALWRSGEALPQRFRRGAMAHGQCAAAPMTSRSQSVVRRSHRPEPRRSPLRSAQVRDGIEERGQPFAGCEADDYIRQGRFRDWPVVDRVGSPERGPSESALLVAQGRCSPIPRCLRTTRHGAPRRTNEQSGEARSSQRRTDVRPGTTRCWALFGRSTSPPCGSFPQWHRSPPETEHR
jgi:hypothetical protein